MTFKPSRRISKRYHVNHYKYKRLIGLHGMTDGQATAAKKFATTEYTVSYWMKKVFIKVTKLFD
jgi:hypothetical protein